MFKVTVVALTVLASVFLLAKDLQAGEWENGRKWADKSAFEAVITNVGDVHTVGFVIKHADCNRNDLHAVRNSVINGVAVQMVAMCISSSHNAYMAMTRAGKLYILGQFKKEGRVVIEDEIIFSAKGFNKALKTYINKPVGI